MRAVDTPRRACTRQVLHSHCKQVEAWRHLDRPTDCRNHAIDIDRKVSVHSKHHGQALDPVGKTTVTQALRPERAQRLGPREAFRHRTVDTVAMARPLRPETPRASLARAKPRTQTQRVAPKEALFLRRVLDLNQEHPRSGARRIRDALLARRSDAPSEGTIGRWLAFIRHRCPVCRHHDRHDAMVHAIDQDLGALELGTRIRLPRKRRQRTGSGAVREAETSSGRRDSPEHQGRGRAVPFQREDLPLNRSSRPSADRLGHRCPSLIFLPFEPSQVGGRDRE